MSPVITLVLSLVITKSETSSLRKKLHHEYSGATCYPAKPKSKKYKFLTKPMQIIYDCKMYEYVCSMAAVQSCFQKNE